MLRTARTSAVKARTALLNQISGALTSAPEEIRARYRGLGSEARAKAMAASRPSGDPSGPVVATQVTLKRLAMRHRFLTEEIAETDADLAYIVSTHAPEILEVNGVGAVVASQLLVTFGDNPERMTGEAAFAALAGVAPVPASSGKTNRHRLSRGGDRQANSALYRIVLVRMSKDKRTRDYVAKRTQEGLSKKEIIRCLKRYVAREIYRVIKNPRPAPLTNDLRPIRLALGLTQAMAAVALGTWPTAISRIERGKCRDLQVIAEYRAWLQKQPAKTN